MQQESATAAPEREPAEKGGEWIGYRRAAAQRCPSFSLKSNRAATATLAASAMRSPTPNIMKKYSPFCTVYPLPNSARLSGLAGSRRDQADDTSAVEAYVKGRVQPPSGIAEGSTSVGHLHVIPSCRWREPASRYGGETISSA
jgi:hypothetical protein